MISGLMQEVQKEKKKKIMEEVSLCGPKHWPEKKLVKCQ